MKIENSQNPELQRRDPKPARRLEAQHGRHEFARLLHSAPTPTAVPRAAISVAFDVRTEIGDDAVRFDARPIVGQVSTHEKRRVGEPRHVGARPMVTDDLAPRSDPAAPPRIMGRPAPTAMGRAAEVGRSGKPVEILDEPPVVPDTRSRSGEGPANPRTSLRSAPPSTRGEESSRQTPRSTPLPPERQAFSARLDALPREVTVSIRGLTLSADERPILVEVLRDLLRQYRFGERAVRIVALGREAR